MSFNIYAQYPTTPGIVIVRDRYNNHGFTMYTHNIRSRIQKIDKEHRNGKYGCAAASGSSWSAGRMEFAENAGTLVYDFVEMPNTSKEMRKSIAEALDAESKSKTEHSKDA